MQQGISVSELTDRARKNIADHELFLRDQTESRLRLGLPLNPLQRNSTGVNDSSQFSQLKSSLAGPRPKTSPFHSYGVRPTTSLKPAHSLGIGSKARPQTTGRITNQGGLGPLPIVRSSITRSGSKSRHGKRRISKRTLSEGEELGTSERAMTAPLRKRNYSTGSIDPLPSFQARDDQLLDLQSLSPLPPLESRQSRRSKTLSSIPSYSLSSPSTATSLFDNDSPNDPKKVRREIVEQDLREEDDLITPGFFPLDMFDDLARFESCTPEEWLAKRNRDGVVKAVSKYFGTDGTFSWRSCTVLEFLQSEEKYKIRWSDSGKEKLVSRLNLCFEDEDLAAHEERTKVASENRRFNETQYRRQLRIDSLKDTSVSSLPPSRIKRINSRIQLSKATRESHKVFLKKIRERRLNIPDRLMLLREAIFQEVQEDYVKLSKKIEYDHQYPISNELGPCSVSQKEEPKQVPRKATIDFPRQFHFSQIKKVFEDISLLANPLTVRVQKQIWERLYEIRSHCLLVGVETEEGEPRPPIELKTFERAHRQNLDSTLQFFVNEVQPALQPILLSAMNREDNQDKELPKYYRLLTQINQMQNDILQSILLRDLENFYHLLVDQASHSEEPLSFLKEPWHSKCFSPLLKIKVVYSDGALQFQPSPEEFLSVIPRVIEEVITGMASIPALEVPTLDGSQVIRSSYLPGIDPNDVEVRNWMEKIEDALTQNTDLLPLFKEQLNKTDSFTDLTKEDYLQDYETSLSGFRGKVEALRNHQQHVKQRVQESLHLAMFEVECQHLKDMFQIATDLFNRLMLSFNEKAHGELVALRTRFEDILSTISHVPTTPEELHKLTQFVRTTVGEQYNLQESIETICKKYALMEEFSFEVPLQEFQEKWDLIAWPGTLKKRISDIEKNNQLERLKMIRDLRISQKKLDLKIEQIHEECASIEQYRELEIAISVGDKVRQIWTDVEKAKADADRYSKHEELFDFDISGTPLTVDKLISSFQMSYQLWRIASDVVIQFDQWMTTAFVELNPEGMIKLCTDALSTVEEVEERFREKKSSGIFNVALQLKSKVDEFNEWMPLIAKLRHPGVRPRHWTQIANDVGVPLPSEEELTLGFILQVGLNRHEDIINSITDVAINEYSLEVALNKMNTDLATIVVQFDDTDEIPRIGNFDDLSSSLTQQLDRLQEFMASQYATTFQTTGKKWEGIISDMREILTKWDGIYQGLCYFHPIFSSSEIRRHLPGEGRKFSAVDSTWKSIHQYIDENPKLMLITGSEKVVRLSSECRDLLDLIKKGVNNFAEMKRNQNPQLIRASVKEILDSIINPAHNTSEDP